MSAAAASSRGAAWIPPTAAAAGAVGFLGPHLFFLFWRGQATFFNPGTSLWPAILLLAAAPIAMITLTRVAWRPVAFWCTMGAIGGNVLYLVVRGARGDDLGLWPIALVLGAALSVVPIMGGSAIGALVKRLFR